ncbi:MAG: ABC transporter permease [Planctomycetes bacterium]|nr:ABC transporter permease [Planctomycetota bacterium]MCB9918269.1 ABC transporter permease [Planctomycetota bacterium]
MALLPFRYNLRSLFVRKASTLLTVSSIAATVAVLAGMLALGQGFATLFAERGRNDLAVILRKGAGSEGESAFDREAAQTLIKGSPEIAVGPGGDGIAAGPLASAELYLAIRRRKVDGGETNVPIRGVEPATFAIHGSDLRIVEGDRFARGSDELIVGRALVGRIRNCRVGETLVINTTPFRVVGIFESKGAYASEIWGDVDRLMSALHRPSYSRILAVVDGPERLEALAARLANDPRTPAKVLSEREYLRSQTAALSGLFGILGYVLATIMGLAAIFTGTNALLAALSSRTHEIGVLLAMGYRPFAVFVSFLVEAALLGLVGGLFGCLLALPLNGIRTGTMNFDTFSEFVFSFRTTPRVLGSAMGFAIVLGLVGGAIPAAKAAMLRPVEALRRG